MSHMDLLRRFLRTQDERGRQTSDWFRLIVRRSVRKMVGNEEGPILDAGGGDGLLFDPCVSSLADKTTILDNDDNTLQIAQRHYKGGGTFVHGDITSMSFHDGMFHLSVCIGTFYNFPSQELVQKGLKELARVTKKGGRIIVEFRNGDSPIVRYAYHSADRYDTSLCHLPLKPYSLKQIQDMVVKSHMRIIKIKKIGFLCNPLIFSYIIEATHMD